MEPVSLIIAALATGAATAVKDTAGTACKDAYEGLKALIKKKFANNEAAKIVLDEHEKDPETYEAPLKKKLTEAGVDQDEEIQKVAEELLKQLQSKTASTGESYQLNVGGNFTGVGRDVDTGGGDANLNFGNK